MNLFIREPNGEYRHATNQELRGAISDVARLNLRKGAIISAPAIVAKLYDYMSLMPTEQVLVLFLDNANRLVEKVVLSKGAEGQSSIIPKRICRMALLNYATGIIVVHNHPSGDLKPSESDKAVTDKIEAACKTLDIRFLDHIIITNEGYFSFKTRGLLK